MPSSGRASPPTASADGGRRGRRRDVAGQGDAHRLDGQAAARGGAPAPLDEPSRERLAEIYERSVAELSEALSPDLQEELKMLALPFRDGEVPSEARSASPRPSSSAGSRACSTASRRRCSPSSSPPASSSSRCASCPGPAGRPGMPGRPAPAQGRPGTYLAGRPRRPDRRRGLRGRRLDLGMHVARLHGSVDVALPAAVVGRGGRYSSGDGRLG